MNVYGLRLTEGWVDERAGSAMVRVRLQSRARKDAIVGVRGDSLIVSVTAPPVGGRANEALRKLMGRAVRIAPSRIVLVRGKAARDKLLRVEGVSAAEVRALVGRPLERARQDSNL